MEGIKSYKKEGACCIVVADRSYDPWLYEIKGVEINRIGSGPLEILVVDSKENTSFTLNINEEDLKRVGMDYSSISKINKNEFETLVKTIVTNYYEEWRNLLRNYTTPA